MWIVIQVSKSLVPDCNMYEQYFHISLLVQVFVRVLQLFAVGCHSISAPYSFPLSSRDGTADQLVAAILKYSVLFHPQN